MSSIAKINESHNDILNVIKKDIVKVYTPQDIKKSLKSKYHISTIYSCLSDLHKLGLLIRVKKGLYQYKTLSSLNKNPIPVSSPKKSQSKNDLQDTIEEKISPGITNEDEKTELEELKQAENIALEPVRAYLDSNTIKDGQIKGILKEIVENRYPLGIHLIRLHRRGIVLKYSDYTAPQWETREYQKKNSTKTFTKKITTIKGVEVFGITTITIHEGKSNNNKPAMTLEYQGDTKIDKLFLTEETYPLWFKGVNKFLKEEMGLNFNINSLYLKMMDINMDIDISKNPKKYSKFTNVRWQQANKTFELYILANGKLRFGARATTKSNLISLTVDNPLKAFLSLDDEMRDTVKSLKGETTVIKKEVNDIKQNISEIKTTNGQLAESTKKEFESLKKEFENLGIKDLDGLKEFTKKEILDNSNILLEHQSTFTEKISQTVDSLINSVDQDSNALDGRLTAQDQTIVGLNGQIQVVQQLIQQLPISLTQIIQQIENGRDKSNEDIFDKFATQLSETLKLSDSNTTEVLVQLTEAQKQDREKFIELTKEKEDKIDKLIKLAEIQYETEKLRRENREKPKKRRLRLFKH